MNDDSERILNPYITVKVKCPVCDKESSQRYLKSKYYQPVEMEKDHRVVSYKWSSEEFSHIRPENYYVWHCPHCQFCDESDVFREKIDRLWKGKLELIKDRIIAASRDSSGFLAKAGLSLDESEECVSLETALVRHLMACYIQETFLTTNNRLPHKLSRFYLRLAWLFREMGPGGIQTSLDYLKALKGFWPDLPLNENEALARAITYYEELLNQSGKEDDVKKEITLMFLLQNLYFRSGKLDNSYLYVRSVFTLAMKTRQLTKTVLDKGVSSGELNQQRIEQMRGLITWLSNAIDQASMEGDNVNLHIFKEEYSRAREEAMKVQPLLPKPVVDKLRELGFHEITCRKVASLCRPVKGQKLVLPMEPPGIDKPQPAAPYADTGDNPPENNDTGQA